VTIVSYISSTLRQAALVGNPGVAWPVGRLPSASRCRRACRGRSPGRSRCLDRPLPTHLRLAYPGV